MGFFSFTKEIAMDLGTANTIIMHVDKTLEDKEVQKWIPWAQVDFK